MWELLPYEAIYKLSVGKKPEILLVFLHYTLWLVPKFVPPLSQSDATFKTTSALWCVPLFPLFMPLKFICSEFSFALCDIFSRSDWSLGLLWDLVCLCSFSKRSLFLLTRSSLIVITCVIATEGFLSDHACLQIRNENISEKKSEQIKKEKGRREHKRTFFWRREFTWFILSCTSGNSSKVPKAHRSRKSPDTRTYFFRIGRLGYKRFLFDPPCLWATELVGWLIERPLFSSSFFSSDWVSEFNIFFVCSACDWVCDVFA